MNNGMDADGFTPVVKRTKIRRNNRARVSENGDSDIELSEMTPMPDGRGESAVKARQGHN